MADTKLVQKLYIAYFGRPADPAGATNAGALIDWSQSAEALLNDFGKSAEYTAQFSGLTSPQIVEQIYQNMFGRSAEAAGLNFWAAKIQSGEITLAKAVWTILSGVTAGSSDDTAVNSKVTWAEAFTAKLAADAAANVAYNATTLASVKAQMLTIKDAATLATANTGLDAFVTTMTTNGSGVAGQTFTLTVNTDNITGTAGNDTINASTGLSADGSTSIATTNALDMIDGGAGIDTLVIENTGGKNTLAGTIVNVENLTFVGAGNVNNNANIDLANFSGTFTLSQTADTAVAVDNVTTQTLALNKVADTTILTAALGAAQTSATLSNTAAVGDVEFSISGTKLDTVSVSTDKTATAKKVLVTDTGNTTKTFNVAASAAAAVEVESTAVENINVSGAGAVTLTTTATAPTKTLSSANSTGGVTYATELGTAVVFTGGAGKDSVAFGATTKAQTLGAGDDTATISADLGTGGSIDAGDGTDTLTMTATLAATLDNNTDFNAKVSNFEKLSVTAATNQTLNLTNLDGLNYVIEAGDGNTLTIDNMVSGGTFEFTDTSTATAVNIKDAATGTDVLNVKLSAAATFAAGTLTVANVETINIDSDDTAAAPAKDGTVKHTMTLTADKATKVVISGDAAVNLTLTGSTKITEINASANEAGIQTNLSVASGITLTGTAKADTITLGNLSVVTGGAGKDVYTLTTPTNGNTYATITDFVATETIQFTDKGNNGVGTALGSKISLAPTAAFADYLAAAAAGDATTNGIGKWFQVGGDTYLVLDRSAEATFQNGADEIVKLTGTLDLSKSSFDTNGLFTFTAA